VVGFRTSPTRLITQGDGSAYRCDAGTLQQLMRQVPALEKQLHRFGQKLAMQTTQIAACNRLHEVVERLARWILMTQDRIQADRLPLTQRVSGADAGDPARECYGGAGTLQKAGLIAYTRAALRFWIAKSWKSGLRVLRDRAEAVARVGERDAIAFLQRTILVRERTDTRADSRFTVAL